jgi:hypothetical protein
MSKVAVLMGGWSPEREVSLVSGKACAEGLPEGQVPAPPPNQGSPVGAETELFRESGVGHAERHLAASKQEIVHSGRTAHVGELDANHEGLLREGFPPYPPVDVPDESAHVQLSWVKLAREPSLAPRAQLADDRRQLEAGRCQPVLGPALALVTLDDPRVGQLTHARREHGARDTRDPPLNLSEAAASTEKLAHDEERPPLSEQIEGPRHRAELSVALHAPDDNPNSPAPQYGFRTGVSEHAHVACHSADHSHAARAGRHKEETS